ncbi:MAG: GNAT family N-acetyltransferase [Nevskia sp.]|nr:GNAT family N-acetyltransferase [Nevskia sp.]
MAARWQALETRADPSFFQSWTWVGCLAKERFPDPILLVAEEDGRTVALALFNRSRRRFVPGALHLGESGGVALDSVFVERNGPLIERGRDDLLAAVLRTALNAPVAAGERGGHRRLVLSGVDERHLLAARAAIAGGGYVCELRARPAPFVDLAALRRAGTGFLQNLSANTRYQLRRSARRYAEAGPLAIQRPADLADAWQFLDELAVLHQATWQRRGLPGMFASPDFLRFHRTLLARALPRGEVDLLRMTAGGRAFGYLYNFRFRGRVLTYQSGFDYAAAGPHEKPGMTSHHLAIEASAAEGMDCYDFLAGADRYKTSLANGVVPLHWLEISPRWSVEGMLNGLHDVAQAWRGWERRR